MKKTETSEDSGVDLNREQAARLLDLVAVQ